MKPKKTSSRKPAAAPKSASKPPKAKARSGPPPIAAAAERKTPKLPASIPPLLLEGDSPSSPAVTGPGQRYRLTPAAPLAHWGRGEAAGQLPEAYGTGQLLLTARDPHWLYAHWDLTRDQQVHYNSLSVDRHLVLRVYLREAAGAPLKEVHLHPESRHWFVHVGQGGMRYAADLGYYRPAGHWISVSTSKPTITPPDTLSKDTSIRFGTIPFEVPFEQLLAEVKVAVSEHVPLIEAVQQLRNAGHPALPSSIRITPAEWTPAQERALAEVVSIDTARQVWIGSLEITELLRRQLEQRLGPGPGAPSAAPSSWFGAEAAVTSPAGLPTRVVKREFWFNVNAELIVYGATEPDARVTLGGRTIKLRPDGTFSLRFALPDGRYEILAAATAARGTDTRRADLKFSRFTRHQGQIGTQPQSPGLKNPAES
jgi:hypothetical protein